MKEHYAMCLGTFTPKEAEEIKRLVYEGGKSRTVSLTMRGRGKNGLAETEVGKKFWKEFKNGVPKRYANKYALYVRPRPMIERIKNLAEKVNRFGGGDSLGIRDVTKIIRDLKKLGYPKRKIVKMLGVQESEVK